MQQFGADFVADFGDVGIGSEAGDFEDQLARQGVAVGVQAQRGQGQEHVAGAHGAGLEDAAALDDAHDESGEIVFAGA